MPFSVNYTGISNPSYPYLTTPSASCPVTVCPYCPIFSIKTPAAAFISLTEETVCCIGLAWNWADVKTGMPVKPNNKQAVKINLTGVLQQLSVGFTE